MIKEQKTLDKSAKNRMATPDVFKPPTQLEIDEVAIEKCSLIWKPFNYYEWETQRKIDKRLIKQSIYHPFIFNHFECLKSIGTKSGLVRSL